MACEVSAAKLDAYLDGELPSAEAGVLSAHLRTCSSCAADALSRVQLKRSIAAAGKRYESSAELRAKISRMSAAKERTQSAWHWKLIAIPALLVVILSVATGFYMNREISHRQSVYSELADLHVATLASATPVDVVSTDRHTVKPWFQGKIPFTFNLPELQGTDFTLIGGRVTYLGQSPGAHLIYQIRKHEISVFIFQDRGAEMLSTASGPTHAMSFTVESWTQNGLRYFVLGDVNGNDIAALSTLLRNAG
jgi:anti-sigma factor RsiW